MRRIAQGALSALAAIALAGALDAAPAAASLPCKLAGAESGVAGKACNLIGSPGKLVSAGKNLITGHIGKAFSSLFGSGGGSSSAASTATTALGLAAVVTWAVGGAKLALHETAKVLSETTRPELGTTWFSSTYWRMAGIGVLLTLPFLFAAAVQALLRSDLAMLAHAALGYLPLAVLAISIAAPLTMLLLAATDQLCGLVSAAGGAAGARTLAHTGVAAGLAGLAGAPFVTFLLAAITTGGAVVLWIELAIREAAVYVIVLMLPLAFAALVWPARRIWAVRAIELLVALILAKFAIVAVLGLGGAALGSSHGLTAALAGTVLVLLGAFAPWAILRLLPLSELAAASVGSLAPQLSQAVPLEGGAHTIEGGWSHAVALAMRSHADQAPTVDRVPSDGALGETERLAEQSDPAGSHTTAEAAPDPVGDAARDREEILVPVASATPDGQASTSQRLPGLGPSMQEEDLSWAPLPLRPESFEGGRWIGESHRIWPEREGEGVVDGDSLQPPQDEDLL